MRFPVSLVILTGAATAAGAAVFLMAPAERQEQVPQAPTAPVITGPAADAPAPPGRWQNPALDGDDDEAVRRIAPGAIAAPTVRRAALVREAPRKPLSPQPRSKMQPGYLRKETRKPRLLFNPVATAAGRIEVEGYRIVLSGIEPVPVERDCEADGKTVRCGMMARTAFRNWLRGRAVRCDVPDVAPDLELVSACTVAGTDAATWLVEHGWAVPAGAAPQFAEAEQKARTRQAGLYAFAASSAN